MKLDIPARDSPAPELTEAETALGQVIEGGVPGLRLGESKALTLDHRLNQAALGGVIVNHKDRFGHVPPLP